MAWGLNTHPDMILKDITFTCADCGRQLWYDKMETTYFEKGILCCNQCQENKQNQLLAVLEATL